MKWDINILSILAAFICIFNSCAIYERQPTTLDNALKADGVKIITTDDKEFEFGEIYYEKDILYGMLVADGWDTLQTIIPEDYIKEIYLYSEKKTKTAYTIIGLSLLTGIIVVGIVYGEEWWEYEITH